MDTTNLPALPATVTNKSLVSPRGTVCGERFKVGGRSMADIRNAGKALGKKGNDLTRYVHAEFTKDNGNRHDAASVMLNRLHASGYALDVADVRSKSAALKFVKLNEPKTKAEELVESVAGLDLKTLTALMKAAEEAMAKQIAK